MRIGISLAIALLGACGGKARSTDVYRAHTQQLLDVRTSQIQGCYDQLLAGDANLAGTVKVRFVVAKKTGVVEKATVDPASTAPAPLGECVLQALQGLKLEPADRNEGHATFEYSFQPKPPA
jgi:hypothetical protein